MIDNGRYGAFGKREKQRERKRAHRACAARDEKERGRDNPWPGKRVGAPAEEWLPPAGRTKRTQRQLNWLTKNI